MTTAATSVWDAVVGQPRAVDDLVRAAADPVHAYVFVGPAGCTKDEAARAFAALLLGDGNPDGRDARLALAGEHPDVREVLRTGPRIAAEQVSDIIRAASLAPVESDRKVMILHEFHLLDAGGAARLLKTVEEPPPSTVFVVLADQVPPELVTIASRCVRIDFGPVPDDDVVRVLEADGVEATAAREAAAAAEGNLARARILATDQGLRGRRHAFAELPRRLDGTGHTVVTLTAQVLALIDDAAAPLTARQAAEVAELDERVRLAGERGSGRKQLEERHKREIRRHRTDELRSGLAAVARTYRDALVAGGVARPDAVFHAVTRIHHALEALDRNPNEALLLQSLLLELPSL